ncbi:ligase [Nibricoccus aquaticus]|uniref:Ligase n=1 Tax=Nibricoccus aquaticus TaxID=2576891 RepID=A0A290QFC9_9BACT|nr:lipoate--protein ligase family protein [Nibricoccus aquaticus]ATC64038.1 ligase [Nibricoccus aquaticus]
MQLDILPERHGGAAENMATDFLLLKRYPAERAAHARFRHYDWHRPAFTFGYSQKIAYVRSQLPADIAPDLCRRPTGGGVVDHRDDWTYTLVIPRAHALYDQPAPHSYRAIHAAITDSLIALGQPVELKESCDPADSSDNNPGGATCSAASGPTVCFTRPERYDVIHTLTGAKVAGAAQKRTKDGLLFQGSLARSTLTASLDWDAFQSLLIEKLSAALALPAAETPWPDFAEHELDGLIEQYSAPEWIEQR